MKSRQRFDNKLINPIAGDVHFSSAELISQSMSERNRHIETINTALDKLLDGIITPEEYISIVNSENEKLGSL